MRHLRKLLALSLALCAGCSTLPEGADTYSGEYFYNFEFAYLTPDGQGEQWCMKGDMSRAELPATNSAGRWGTSHVIVQGTLGPPGNYGNLGVCKRVLTVTKIVKVSNMRGRQ